MYKVLTLLALFTCAALACTNDDLIRCVERQADKNRDHKLSLEEIDEWMQKSYCFEAAKGTIKAQDVMDACDVNKDGHLDRGDVLDRKSCLKTNGLHTVVCQLCSVCGVRKNTKR